MTMQYRIAVEGGVRDVDDSKRQVLVSFPWETLDSYRTDFERSSFDEHLQQSLPIMCWQHQRSEPIGRAKEWQKTDKANEFVAGFSDFDAVPRARQAFAQIRDGELTDFSYGFDRAQSAPHPDVRGAIRFTKARMAEISPVSVGSIPGAVAIGIRAEAEVANIRGLVEAGAINETEAEEMIRAAGLAQPVTPVAEPAPVRAELTLNEETRAVFAEMFGEMFEERMSQIAPATVELTPADAFAGCLERAASAGADGDWATAMQEIEAAGLFAEDLADPKPDDGGRSAEEPTGDEPDAGERATVTADEVDEPAADTEVEEGSREADPLDVELREAEALAKIGERLAS